MEWATATLSLVEPTVEKTGGIQEKFAIPLRKLREKDYSQKKREKAIKGEDKHGQNIGVSFPNWRLLKEGWGLRSDTDVA